MLTFRPLSLALNIDMYQCLPCRGSPVNCLPAPDQGGKAEVPKSLP